MLAGSSSNELRESCHVPTQAVGAIVPMRPARILVVEDERHIARLLEFVLGKAGYEVCICHSGEQALHEVKDRKPDAVVLDLVLPGMTGVEFLQIARAAPYHCHCVVVVLSSHWFEQTETILAEAGAALCSKPIAPSSLLRKLEQLGVRASMPRED